MADGPPEDPLGSHRISRVHARLQVTAYCTEYMDYTVPGTSVGTVLDLVLYYTRVERGRTACVGLASGRARAGPAR